MEKEKKVYYEPVIHYSFYNEDNDSYEYTDSAEKANEICVYTQVREVETDNLVDGIDEKDFPNTEDGLNRAIEYAISLSNRPDYKEYSWH